MTLTHSEFDAELSLLIKQLQTCRPELKYDVSGHSSSSRLVKQKDSGAFEQSASQRTAVTLRVWDSQGRVGVVQLSSLHPEVVLSAVDMALETAAYGPTENLPVLPNSDSIVSARPTDASAPRTDEPDLDFEVLCEALDKSIQQVKSAHPDIQLVPYNSLKQMHVRRFYGNSAGLLKIQKNSNLSAVLYARGQSEGYRPRATGHWGEGVSLRDVNLPNVARVTSERLIAHLKPVKISSGRYPVVLAGPAFLDLLDAFGNFFNAQNILDKQSLSTKDSLGQMIASPLLTVADEPMHEWHVAPPLFDGEGTAVRSVPLIDKGVLCGLWHHSVSARAFSTQSTGHARVGAKMTVAPWFWSVAAGTGLGNFVSDCIWIEELSALHAGVDKMQGSFSLPFLGFRIQNGQRQSLEGVTVAGDIFEVLKTICAIDDKLERAEQGASPAIAVPSLSITCEE
jgi:PmbA protein